jgi:hypothetical protein
MDLSFIHAPCKTVSNITLKIPIQNYFYSLNYAKSPRYPSDLMQEILGREGLTNDSLPLAAEPLLSFLLWIHNI